jgi:hypothetical protein
MQLGRLPVHKITNFVGPAIVHDNPLPRLLQLQGQRYAPICRRFVSKHAGNVCTEGDEIGRSNRNCF